MQTDLALEDVPRLTGYEHADYFLDALSIALCYHDDVFKQGFPRGLFDSLSGFTGRGWLIGFDDAAYYWERSGITNPDPSFAVSSLEAYLKHSDSIVDAFRFISRSPELLWNRDCTCSVDASLAAGLIGLCRHVDAGAVRAYVTDYLASRDRPLVALLHIPTAKAADMVLLTGYESSGDTILGRSRYQSPGTDNSGPYGYFRLPDWEQEVLAVLGVGKEKPTEWDKHPCFIAIENGLKLCQSYTDGTKHYGLHAYDAWERALLDDACIDGAADAALSPRLQYHSIVAGAIACQKAFTAMPECQAPSMGIIEGLVRRADAGTLMIHGLMWDAWQAVGGYWRAPPRADGPGLAWEGTEDLTRFRDRSVRERAAGVIRRAKRVDSESIEFLREARDDWERCLGHGCTHPCPCWGSTVCARV